MRRATLDFFTTLRNFLFQSTLSVRRATIDSAFLTLCAFISIHALREESDCLGLFVLFCPTISIHALREESDIRRLFLNCYENISIHALREESDFDYIFFIHIIELFQSTLSVRRATWRLQYRQRYSNQISIHALREESDEIMAELIEEPVPFQSTLSVRRATAKSNIIFTLKSTIYLHFFTKL